MDDSPNRPLGEKHDADEPLTRDDSSYFAQHLGEEWRPVEPGIYQFVGRPTDGPGANGDTGDSVTAHRLRDNGDASGEAAHHRRWPPWRRG